MEWLVSWSQAKTGLANGVLLRVTSVGRVEFWGPWALLHGHIWLPSSTCSPLFNIGIFLQSIQVFFLLPLWRKGGHSLIFKLDYKGSGRMILILLFSLVAVKNQCFPSSLLRNPDESLPGLVMTLCHLRHKWFSSIHSVKSQSQPWCCNTESWSLRERRALNSQVAAPTGNRSCLCFTNSPPRTPSLITTPAVGPLCSHKIDQIIWLIGNWGDFWTPSYMLLQCHILIFYCSFFICYCKVWTLQKKNRVLFLHLHPICPVPFSSKRSGRFPLFIAQSCSRSQNSCPDMCTNI